MSTTVFLIRIIATILVLLIMARLNGPKQISQLCFYDYISGITVGSLAGSVSIDHSHPHSLRAPRARLRRAS